jgi:hypothetical protein
MDFITPTEYKQGGASLSKKQLKCPDCGLDAEWLRALGEEVPIPKADSGKPLRRLPFLGVVARNYLVKCPEHGERIVQEFRHHLSSIPKKSSRRNAT